MKTTTTESAGYKLKMTEVKARLREYDDRNNIHFAMVRRQKKLKNLVANHGVEMVALAGGYAESTLKQYLRSSSPNIGKDNLDKASFILKNL